MKIGLPRDQLECRLSVSPVEGEKLDASLELELTNTTDGAIRLPMFTITTIDKRLFIPRTMHDGVIEIKGHTTQTLKLSWRSILEDGVWTARNEPISEKWPGNDPPEGQQYFRFNVGGQGLLPAALPAPERMTGVDEVDWSSLDFSADRLPRDMPQGNFGRIPIHDWRPAPQSPSLRPKPGTEEAGWMDAEYFLQYRIRVEQHDQNGKPTSSAIPMVYLDIRNKGEKQIQIEMHQTQHQLVINDDAYVRADQPWAGSHSIPTDGSFLTLPFLLSPDWKDSEVSTKPLRLSSGKHKARIDLTLLETIPAKADQPTSRAKSKWRNLRTREFEIAVFPVRGPIELDELMLENIHRELVVYPRFHSPKVSENLKQLVLRGQPESGNYLISKVGRGTQMAPDPASSVIAQLWDLSLIHI